MQALISYQAATETRFTKLESAIERLTELATKQENINQQMHASIRSVEASVSQIAKEIGQRNPGKLPSTSLENPKGEHCNAISVTGTGADKVGITLRGGKTLEARQIPTQEEQKHTEEEVNDAEPEGTSEKENLGTAEPAQKPVQKKKWELAKERRELEEQCKEKETEQIYRPPLPFPQRFKKQKEDQGFAKFVEMLRKIEINIPFADAISQIPAYTKFLKEILTNKRKIDEVDCIPLSGQCNSILRGELPEKRADEGVYAVPCKIGAASEMNALCDLGSSINLMPYPVFRRLGLVDVVPTRMSLQFADKSTKLPMGIAENILVKIENLIFPVDFVILDMKEDPQMPLILGRPFLYTAKANIDMENGKLTLKIANEVVELDIP